MKSERILSNQLIEHIGERVLVQGWLHTTRELGKLVFLILRERTGLIQVVIDDKDSMNLLKNMQPGTILSIIGKVMKTDATESGVELINPEIAVDVPITEVSPVAYNKKSLDVNIDTELDYRPLVIRNPKKMAIFKAQAVILKGFADSMREQGFTEFRAPVIQNAPSESGASVFEVDYFEGKAYLAQSPQVYKQIMVGAFERAFTITPVFRAEKHNTTRHIMELTQMDGEMGFIKDYTEILDVIEKTVRHIVSLLKSECEKDLILNDVKLPTLPTREFPRLKVKEALEIIEKRTGKSAKRDELDLDPEDERKIGRYALEEFGSDFLWLIGFKKDKNFYTWNSTENPDESISFDLAFKGLELLSGTHRIHLFDELYKNFKAQGLTDEYYIHYFQAFKYGMPSEGGFSFGLERFTQQLFELKNIREATLWPSDLKRIAAANRKLPTIKGEKMVVSQIRKLLDSRAIQYEFAEHEPTITSEDASRIRNVPAEQGAKALILIGKKSGDHYMVVVPGNKKLDSKAVGEKIGESVEFEKPDNIFEKYGIKVGGVPPFGNILGMQVFIDESTANREVVSFNAGMQTCSITMNGKDLAEVTDATIGKWTKSE